MRKILYKNATFVSMTGIEDRYSYMGITGDTITFLGNDMPDDYYDETVDLNGRFVFPTLCDSHTHLLYSIVLAASAFNICNVENGVMKPDSLEGIEKSIREYVEKHKKQRLIVANQYVASAIKEGRLPTKQELDEWSGEKEIIVFSIDGHSCALSSSALEKIGIESETGILTGQEYDHSQGKVTGYVASGVTLSTLATGIANFTNMCLDYGITKICAMDGDEPDKGIDVLLHLITFIARRMDIEVRLFPQYFNFDILKNLGRKMNNLRIGGCSKWELDGSIGSHSAAFYKPYKDTGTVSNTYYENGDVEKKVRQALERRITFSCHAIGTKAIDQIVSAYRKCEELIPEYGPMCRIDHFEFPTKEAVDFIKKHRIAITFQPGYAFVDKRYIHSYERNLRDEELDCILPVKEMTDNNVVMLGSSDSPVQSINPYEQMVGMMDYYDELQSINAYEAVKTYTYNSGVALNEKDGALKLGYKASFFTCEKDIVSLSKQEITEVKAEKVFLNGKELKRKQGTLRELLRMILKKPNLI